MLYNIFRVIGKNFLKIFNLKLVKIVPNHSEEILTAFAKKNKNIKFLQIGANDGISHDCLYKIVLKYKWQGVAVEPLEEFFKKLQLNYSFYNLVRPVRYALHPTEKNMTIFKLNPLKYCDYGYWANGIASFNKNHLIKHNILERDIIEEIVPCINLMELITNNNLEKIDYLQIDTEGFDVEVLKMIDFNCISPKLIRFEYSNLNREELNTAIDILSNYTLKKDGSDIYASLKE